MTHDELLAKLVITEKDGENIYVPLRRYQVALRAVVELHKPNGSCCSHCVMREDYEVSEYLYPCPTIKAIEKELN